MVNLKLKKIIGAVTYKFGLFSLNLVKNIMLYVLKTVWSKHFISDFVMNYCFLEGDGL